MLRSILTTRPFLILPNFDLAFILDTDACNYAVGAVLSQEQDDAIRPVAYFSKHLSPAQKNYATTEKELLAIVLAVEYFSQYLWGREFTVNTDHQPLQWLFHTAKPSARLARWLIRLSDFKFAINYKPGKSNANADAMSRWPLEDDSEIADEEDEERIIAAIRVTTEPTSDNGTSSETTTATSHNEPTSQPSEHYRSIIHATTKQREQFEDADIQWIIELISKHQAIKPRVKDTPFDSEVRHILFRKYNQLVLEDEVLYYTTMKDGQQQRRYVLPKQLVDWVIEVNHKTPLAAHLGVDKTFSK